MNCSRCHGLMVREHFLDFDGTIGQTQASGHRCMNCGNVHDPVIEHHRLARIPQKLVPPSHALYNANNEFYADRETVMTLAA
mgnify:CR=1 FL=1